MNVVAQGASVQKPQKRLINISAASANSAVNVVIGSQRERKVPDAARQMVISVPPTPS